LSFSEAFAHPELSNAFNVLDTNADGVLSRAEAAQVLAR
jgi:Ca2+-binding EF-hand superfamily protein